MVAFLVSSAFFDGLLHGLKLSYLNLPVKKKIFES